MAGRYYLALKLVREAVEDDLQGWERRNQAKRRQRSTVGEISEKNFVQRYPLTKCAFEHFCSVLRIKSDLKGSQRVSLETKFLQQIRVSWGRWLCIIYNYVVLQGGRAYLYYSRKHYHSLNVQMISDDQGRILGVNPKFGEATHDAFVWENKLYTLYSHVEPAWLLNMHFLKT